MLHLLDGLQLCRRIQWKNVGGGVDSLKRGMGLQMATWMGFS